MFYAYLVLLLVLDLVWLFLILFGLPGSWLMILSAVLFDWWREEEVFHLGTIGATVALAALGEIAELLGGIAGARRAGGSRRGALGALVGAFIGALLGTPWFPVVGTIIGLCAGAFLGAVLVESMIGRPAGEAVRAGKGAAIGHFIGVTTKLALGVTIFVVLAVAAFVR